MKKIAIIDDDIYIGNMLEELLRREGYAVLRAYSGTEALYLLSHSRPDLILLDLCCRVYPVRRFCRKSKTFRLSCSVQKRMYRTR